MPGYVIHHRRHSPPKWKQRKIYTYAIDDSLEWVRWIERFVIGQTDPRQKLDANQQNIETYQLKSALEIGASLIGVEQGWRFCRTARNAEISAHYTAYHVGFSDRPDHRKCSIAQFEGEPNKIEKFVVGSTNFSKSRPEYEIENQIHRINRALTYARIVGHERIITMGHRRDEEKALSYLVYHLGFKHKLL